MRALLFIGSVVFLGICLAVAIPQTQARPNTANAGKTWEYKVVEVRSLVKEAKDAQGVVAELEKSFNAFGSDHWELCLEVKGGFVFKREK